MWSKSLRNLNQEGPKSSRRMSTASLSDADKENVDESSSSRRSSRIGTRKSMIPAGGPVSKRRSTMTTRKSSKLPRTAKAPLGNHSVNTDVEKEKVKEKEPIVDPEVTVPMEELVTTAFTPAFEKQVTDCLARVPVIAVHQLRAMVKENKQIIKNLKITLKGSKQKRARFIKWCEAREKYLSMQIKSSANTCGDLKSEKLKLTQEISTAKLSFKSLKRLKRYWKNVQPIWKMRSV